MFPGPLRGFVALAAFGDQVFDFTPLLLRVCVSLLDFAGQKYNALISHLKNNRTSADSDCQEQHTNDARREKKFSATPWPRESSLRSEPRRWPVFPTRSSWANSGKYFEFREIRGTRSQFQRIRSCPRISIDSLNILSIYSLL